MTGLLGAACGAPEPTLRPTRGYILISLDTLGARHLGAYGAERQTSPFFDSLAARGTLFENAFVQYPSTLVSHVSMFTGLYPQEHGVYPPSSVLSPQIPSLPERFRDAGFRTAGHAEAGYVSKDFGFHRGFDEFVARPVSDRRLAEATFERGLDFLRGLESSDRFFLFLHTYAVHNPYEPAEEYAHLFWPGDPPAITDSSGPFLRDVNMGRHQVPPETVAFYRAQYDAEIRQLDGMLEGLVAELEAIDLLDETTLIFTSDHGEEFRQHGKLAHNQVYPETLHVPLLIVHPNQQRGARVAELVQSIDLAPTLYELAGLEPVDRMSGESLVPLLTGSAERRPRRIAYAEVFDQENQKTLIEAADGRLVQYLTSLVIGEPGGTWATRRAVLDIEEPRLDLRLVSFHEPREIEVRVDGEPLSTLSVGTDWRTFPIDLSPDRERRRVVLSTADCGVPMWLGLGADTRCLSFKLQGAEIRRSELFDLDLDPEARTDLSAERRELFARLANDLRAYRWEVHAAPSEEKPSSETVERLKALGYVN